VSTFRRRSVVWIHDGFVHFVQVCSVFPFHLHMLANSSLCYHDCSVILDPLAHPGPRHLLKNPGAREACYGACGWLSDQTFVGFGLSFCGSGKPGKFRVHFLSFLIRLFVHSPPSHDLFIVDPNLSIYRFALYPSSLINPSPFFASSVSHSFCHLPPPRPNELAYCMLTSIFECS